MSAFLRHRMAAPALFLGLFVLSRVALAGSGLAPDPMIVAYHWQHLDVALLAEDPIGALWLLHAQPPLWNAILAAAAQVTGPSPEALTSALHGFNIALTALAGLMTLSILGMAGLRPVAAIAGAVATVMFPSVIYYENLAFYPQLTYALITCVVWLLVRLGVRGGRWPVYGVMAALVALSWIWALFHPVFVAGFAGGLILRRGRKHGYVAAAIASVLLSALPTIKNAALFGVPSASSWIGLNIAQTAPSLGAADGRACNFHDASVEIENSAPGSGPAVLSNPVKSVGGVNLNHRDMIARSQACLDVARSNITHNIPAWATGRLAALAASHQKRPFNYETDPAGWGHVFGPILELQAALGPIARSASIAFYILIWFATLRQLYRRPDAVTALLMLIVVYFTLVTHIANGAEQERMRYTIEPIYLFLAFRLALDWFRSRQPATERPGASHVNTLAAQ